MSRHAKLKTRLHMCRHGEVDPDHRGRIYGDLDVALAPEGLVRFEALAEDLADYPFAAIYSSPLRRALDGARLIAEPHGLDVVVDPRFKEIHRGHWNGLTYEELEATHPGAISSYLDDPDAYAAGGAETHVELADRVVPALEELAEAHAGEEALIVCHAQVMRSSVARLLGMPGRGSLRLMTSYGGITTLDHYEDGVWIVQAVNQPTLRRGPWGGRTFQP
ncbi:MAG: histidine phosphatase family protein [Planctomycetes bacterium]|nr:histidine phosphatase family protein [Planctomycetota bacterium]